MPSLKNKLMQLSEKTKPLPAASMTYAKTSILDRNSYRLTVHDPDVYVKTVFPSITEKFYQTLMDTMNRYLQQASQDNLARLLQAWTGMMFGNSDPAFYYYREMIHATTGWINVWQKTMNLFLNIEAPASIGGFELGKNIATTPASTITISPYTHLKKYEHEGQLRGQPLLMVYSLINGPEILDLTPDANPFRNKSMIKALTAAGYDVYLTDWVPITQKNAAQATLDQYIRDIHRATEVIKAERDAQKIHLGGYCMGGVMANIAAALQPEQYQSLINLTTSMTNRAGHGDLISSLSQTIPMDRVDLFTPGILTSNMLVDFFGEITPSPVDDLQMIKELFTTLLDLTGRINRESFVNILGSYSASAKLWEELYNDGTGFIDSEGYLTERFNPRKPQLNLSPDFQSRQTEINQFLVAKYRETSMNDILAWAALTRRDVSAVAHHRFVEEVLQHNDLAEGRFQIDGHTVDLANLSMPVLSILSSKDHIVSPDSVVASVDMMGSEDKTLVQAQGGHVGAIVSPEVFGRMIDHLNTHGG